ncbi:alpha/beta hydrolase [Chitinophaga nivalis]|uniref:Alpha/beta hydrolase n=1 Tax=Chitinophaga nivalis TaxID=2991709 RepID=A0ABT3IKK1_9BACT|nr:alpha/beta hydrolase [Chitinophaga nivalis]MCW3465831.1 alpha/beta hydrolase [Chitinophaga nivalis]MCW3484478.1 alpha/beta hydrolase [Chitinophaga nivalis]
MQSYTTTVTHEVRTYLNSLPAPTGSQPPITVFREMLLTAVAGWSKAPAAVPFISDHIVQAGLHIRIYQMDRSCPQPALLYFHGGGWIRGSIATHDWLCRNLAVGSGCTIVSVDYRLAPEHVFPAAATDGWTALEWLLAHGPEHDIDTTRLAVGGDSSGGNIAIATLLQAKARGISLTAQLLIYPPVDNRMDTGSYQAYATGYGLTRAAMAYCWHTYLGDGLQPAPPLAAVLQNDFAGFPPTLIIAAACDPLRDDGVLLSQKLAAAGVPVTYSLYEGMIHLFFLMDALFPEASAAQLEAAAFLKNRLLSSVNV